jgi:type I restriction-modification system DNA methylase subunit
MHKRFFESLKIWVDKLSEVEFDTDEKTKIELMIRLLNKFIFIQTLDDFFVVDARWIKTNWDEIERKWHAKGKYQVLKEFFSEIDTWFYEYYDTELFRDNVLKYLKKDSTNVNNLYNNLQLVLGLGAWQPTFSSFKGIMQYNFRHIDEDIFGKAYETFLAEVRHDEGIYYTPKYVTEYIVENTVGKTYDGFLSEIERAIAEENFYKVKDLVSRFVSIRVLDPACGSGSFLIKAVRKIMSKYRKLNELLKNLDAKYNRYNGSLVRPKEVEEKVSRLSEIADIVRTGNERELISRLLVRHIHGNDLDSKALEVAKVNIWLEAIKLAPTEFRLHACMLPSIISTRFFSCFLRRNALLLKQDFLNFLKSSPER